MIKRWTRLRNELIFRSHSFIFFFAPQMFHAAQLDSLRTSPEAGSNTRKEVNKGALTPFTSFNTFFVPLAASNHDKCFVSIWQTALAPAFDFSHWVSGEGEPINSMPHLDNQRWCLLFYLSFFSCWCMLLLLLIVPAEAQNTSSPHCVTFRCVLQADLAVELLRLWH